MAKTNKEQTKAQIIDLHERIEVIATDKHPFAKEGEVLLVGTLQVDILKTKGYIR